IFGLPATSPEQTGSLQPMTFTEAVLVPTGSALGLAGCTTTSAVRSPVMSTLADATAAPESSVLRKRARLSAVTRTTWEGGAAPPPRPSKLKLVGEIEYTPPLPSTPPADPPQAEAAKAATTERTSKRRDGGIDASPEFSSQERA